MDELFRYPLSNFKANLSNIKDGTLIIENQDCIQSDNLKKIWHNNDINRVVLNNVGLLAEGVFKFFNSIRRIDFYGNENIFLDKKALKDLDSLEEIDFHGQNVTLDDSCLANTSIRELDLSKSFIFPQARSLQHMKRLKYLKLPIRMANVPHRLLERSPNLEHIDNTRYLKTFNEGSISDAKDLHFTVNHNIFNFNSVKSLKNCSGEIEVPMGFYKPFELGRILRNLNGTGFRAFIKAEKNFLVSFINISSYIDKYTNNQEVLSIYHVKDDTKRTESQKAFIKTIEKHGGIYLDEIPKEFIKTFVNRNTKKREMEW